MLKFAILATTAAVIATVVGDTLATVVLFVAAGGAVAAFWWKFVVPFAGLSLSLKGLPKELADAKQAREEDRQKLVAIEEQADAIKKQVGDIDRKVDHVEKTNARIEKGAEIAAERAAAAINVAEAVRRQLGVVARGDGESDG
jgi:hypothetical protein